MEEILGAALPEDAADVVRDGLTWRESAVPAELRALLPLVREWAVGDDSDRSEKIDEVDSADLEKLVETVSSRGRDIRRYVESVEEQSPCPDECVLLGWLLDTAAEAEDALRSRRGR